MTNSSSLGIATHPSSPVRPPTSGRASVRKTSSMMAWNTVPRSIRSVAWLLSASHFALSGHCSKDWRAVTRVAPDRIVSGIVAVAEEVEFLLGVIDWRGGRLGLRGHGDRVLRRRGGRAP